MPPRTCRLTREERAARAGPLAELTDGVLPRRALREAGISRADVRSEVTAGRWTLHGRQTVQIGTGDLTERGLLWRALWESGGGTVLDGASALVAAGLKGFTPHRIDISIPRNNRRHVLEGVVLHHRSELPPSIHVGLPRVRPEHAALHAARWARTDREAALVLCLVVQQRRVPPHRLLAAHASGRGRGARGAFVALAVRDICDGAHSLGELDFTALCRGRGLPSPTRQVVRTTPDGRIYLDACWEDIGLVAEIDGGHHALGLNPIDDALRQNELVIGRESVLRIPVIGLRLHPDRFMDQVARAHALHSRHPAA